ncbi:MAG: hypothetical protein VX672_08885 [Planctomycetota bacterium]|nr:hypothetical protein [Planctomycetota bacterium]
MIRALIGILAGYLFMATIVILTLFPASLLIDSARIRDPETDVMSPWFIFMVEWPVSLFSAILGGVVAALVAGRAGRTFAIRGLMAFVLIVGLVGAVLSLVGTVAADEALVEEGLLSSGPVETTAAEIELAESQANPGGKSTTPPIQPVWDTFALPLVGLLGILLGGRVVARAAEGLGPPPTPGPDGGGLG